MTATVSSVVAAKLQRCAVEVAGSSEKAVRGAALLLKTSVLNEAPKSLRGMGGARLGAGFDVKKVEDRHTAFLRARGPWQIVEGDTDPHYIVAGLLGVDGGTRAGRQASARNAGTVGAFGGSARGVFGGVQAKTYTSRKGGQRTRRGARAMTIGGNLRAYASHPGTRGKRPWRHGIDKAKPAALALLHRSQTAAVIRGFRS